jgi:predicted nucleic acid-binding protein
VLVDTSVWIDHFRNGNDSLASALETSEVWCHPFVQGELACGNLRNRKEILSLLGALPQAPRATHSEILELVETHGLMGTGLGWIDVHLLGSALLAGIPLWTLDGPLARAVERCRIAAPQGRV